MQDMRNKYNNLEDHHASKNHLNDDTPMCERHEANYIQSGGYHNRNSHDLFSRKSHHDPNDFEKSLRELNNDVKNDLEDFKRRICSMRTVHWKLFARDDELEKVVKERDVLKLNIGKWKESSKNLDELLNNQMSARDKTGLGYGTHMNERSNNSKTDSEISLSVFDVRTSDEESTPTNDRFSKADRYHVVPPPITGNFLTLRADISFTGLDEYAIRKKMIESKTTELNADTINRDKVIIEDWNSDDEDDVSKVQTVSPVKTNETQTVKTRVDQISQTSKKAGIRFKKIKSCFVFNTGKGKMDSDLKKSRWVWRPKGHYLDHVSKDSGSFMLKKILNVVDSGCSSHMTGNKAYLSDYEDYNGGFVAFRSDPKGGKITGKGKIKTANLDFDDVYFVDELKFNLFSISQMCDKKNNVLFTKTKCLILSPSFKLLDESQVVLRAPRKDDVYSLVLKNIIPSGGNSPSISFMRPFGCPLTILNTLDSLGKFDGKSDEGYLLGYSTTSKAFRVYNKRTKRVEENLHIDFLEDQPNVTGTGPNWIFDLDFLTNSMNYIPISVENQVNVDAGTQDSYVAGSSGKDKGPTQEYILLPLQHHRTRIPVEDVALAAHEKPSESSPKENDV
ncbi:ribonuclease H-like domain-containing protein [Tanacetum coccineum]